MLAALAAAAAAAALTVERATYFTVEDFGDFKVVNSTHPDCSKLGAATYVLYPRGTPPPNLGPSFRYFATPLNSITMTQTVDITFLELLGVRESIYASSQYTTSSCVQNLVQAGTILDYNSDASLTHSTNADATLTDPYGASRWAHPSTVSKLLCSASTYEPGPLASAEWIKFYSLFFEKTAEAESVYCQTVSSYQCNAVVASSGVLMGGGDVLYQAPKILMVSFNNWTQWNLGVFFRISAHSLKSKFVMDAGGRLPDLSAFNAFRANNWDGTFIGFQFPLENTTEFHAALALADIIIDESYPHGATLETSKAKLRVDKAAHPIPAYVNQRVYTLDGTMAAPPPTGGIDWFESRVAEPQVFLEDLVSVLHPQSSQLWTREGSLRFLRSLATGAEPTVVTASLCADPALVRSFSGTTCKTLGQSAKVNSTFNLNGFECNKDAQSAPPATCGQLRMAYRESACCAATREVHTNYSVSLVTS